MVVVSAAQRSWAALVLAISSWSLSPLLIVSASDLAPAPVVALYAVSIGAGLAVLALLPSKRYNLKAVVQETWRNHTFYRASIVGVGAFFVYPMLYFSAIQSGPPVLVNLVNYLWPIVGLLMVAIFRQESRSLELALAAAFGFAGAGLAITAGADSGRSLQLAGVLPFILAACGAIVYGAVSASANLRQDREGSQPLSFVLVSLFSGGALSLILLGSLWIFTEVQVLPRTNGIRIVALLAYAALLPCAHLSWLTAIQSRRIPAFASAFLVPVFATGLLAITYRSFAGLQLLASVTLVLSGIVFSSSHERRISVAFAVILSALGSIQVSQALPETLIKGVDPAATVFNEPIVGLVAIVGGFILTNAIARYGRLQSACGLFYQGANRLHQAHEADVQKELDKFDQFVLGSSERQALFGADTTTSFTGRLAPQWSDVELVLMNRISRYEWLVLTLGSIGVILALHVSAITSQSPATIVIRAISTAVVVGVLFAVRDYDLNRPDRLCVVLEVLRNRFGIPIAAGSPLAVRLRYGPMKTNRWIQACLIMIVMLGILSVVLNAGT